MWNTISLIVSLDYLFHWIIHFSSVDISIKPFLTTHQIWVRFPFHGHYILGNSISYYTAWIKGIFFKALYLSCLESSLAHSRHKICFLKEWIEEGRMEWIILIRINLEGWWSSKTQCLHLGTCHRGLNLVRWTACVLSQLLIVLSRIK